MRNVRPRETGCIKTVGGHLEPLLITYERGTTKESKYLVCLVSWNRENPCYVYNFKINKSFKFSSVLIYSITLYNSPSEFGDRHSHS